MNASPGESSIAKKKRQQKKPAKKKSPKKKRQQKTPTLKDLKEDPENPRTIDDGALAGLSTSLEEFGDLSGLTWNSRTGTLVSGHQRLKALREKHGDDLKVKDGSVVTPDGEVFKVRVVDWPAEKHRLASLAANSDKIMGSFTGLAVEQLGEMKIAFPDLSVDLRMDALRIDLEGQFKSAQKDGKTDPDAIPEPPKKAITKPGDVWVLGEHRVLCGDSTRAEDVATLMGGKRAATLVTSPPYWAGMEYDKKIGLVGMRSFMLATVKAWSGSIDRRVWIQTGHTSAERCGEDKTCRKILLDAEWVNAWASEGWMLRHRRCWPKEHFGSSPAGPDTDWVDEAWESLLTFWKPGENKGGQERIQDAGWTMSGVWNVGGARKEGDSIDGHPCPFPVEIASRMVALYSKESDVVADPFLGSGTTIIAAEQLERRCFGLEIEPRYVDVIVERFQNFTGKKAKRKKAK